MLYLFQASGSPPTFLATSAGTSYHPQSWVPAGRVMFLAASPSSLHFFHHVQTHSRSHRESEKGRKLSCLGASCAGPWPAMHLLLGEGKFCRGKAWAWNSLSLSAERGPGNSARLQRQDMRSFFGSAVDLERSESQKWLRVRRGHIFYYIFFLFSLVFWCPCL